MPRAISKSQEAAIFLKKVEKKRKYFSVAEMSWHTKLFLDVRKHVCLLPISTNVT